MTDRTETLPKLTLVSHHLCPYAQRAAIALAEKGVPYERINIDLANKPAWFLEISPHGRVPVLIVERPGAPREVLFESAAILEYLDETLPHPLHPADPAARARHRAWIEHGSAILNQIGRFYSARDADGLRLEAAKLREMFAKVEAVLGHGPYFAGAAFSLVDTVFGPVFRYFDLFDRLGEFGVLSDLPKLAAWRAELRARPSVAGAVSKDYEQRLHAFLSRKRSALAMAEAA